MRQITPEFQARLDADATAFCHCWKLTRRDGLRLGFTDHDRDLAFDGVVFSARAGLDGASAETSLGFSIGGADIAGALSGDTLLESDLGNGLYDGAALETWLVDWRDPAGRMLQDAFTLGEATRTEHAFTAEARSLAHRLDQETGRRFQAACSADLGDARCGVALDAPPFRRLADILASERAGELRIAADDKPAGWFEGGRATFLSGANAGAQAIIRQHRIDGAQAVLDLWSAPTASVAAGDRVAITAGCDKSLSACARKFANVVNFRGFPHMPGNDVLMSYPGAGGPVMDGGSLFS